VEAHRDRGNNARTSETAHQMIEGGRNARRLGLGSRAR
jgi:hypothetical protein